MTFTAVLLAAGAGRRFGGSKLTADYHGRPLLTYALDAVLQAPVERVVLVTGCHADAVQTVVMRHAPGALASGRLVRAHALDAADGLAASLRAGLLAMPDGFAGVFVFLGDMPAVPRGLAPRMVEALVSKRARAVAPVHEGRRGHPVLFARSELLDLLGLKGDQGARPLLDAMGPSCVHLEGFGAGVLEDHDTPESLAAIGARGFMPCTSA